MILNFMRWVGSDADLPIHLRGKIYEENTVFIDKRCFNNCYAIAYGGMCR